MHAPVASGRSRIVVRHCAPPTVTSPSHPPQGVDGVRAPRTDPSAAGRRSNSQPYGRRGTRVPALTCVQLTCSTSPSAPSRTRSRTQPAHRVAAELEVTRCTTPAARPRRATIVLGLGGVQAERLVAQHRVAAARSPAARGGVQEGRRVHGDEVEVRTAARARRPLARRAERRRRRPCTRGRRRTPARRPAPRTRSRSCRRVRPSFGEGRVRTGIRRLVPRWNRCRRSGHRGRWRTRTSTCRSPRRRRGPSPAASAISSRQVRTSQIGKPRAAMPVISPSRGPGPRPQPM